MVTRQRSPNYPGVDLGSAIESSQTLYQRVQRGEFTITDAAKAWGYNSVSGPVRVRLAALRQYDLIDGKKGDNPRLSRKALTFVLRDAHAPGSPRSAVEPKRKPRLIYGGVFTSNL